MRNFLEVWVESKQRAGHVEIRLDDSFYGFWPKKNRRNNAANANLKRTSRGELRIRRPGQLAHFYENIYYDAVDVFYKTNRSMKKVALPAYCVCKFTVSRKLKELIIPYLMELHESPPKYNILGRNGGENCVTLTTKILKRFELISSKFSVNLSKPSPLELIKALSRYRKQSCGKMICENHELQLSSFVLKKG